MDSRPIDAQRMEYQRVSGRYLCSVRDDLVGVRRSGISSCTPRFMLEYALAKSTPELGTLLGIAIVHFPCPIRCVFVFGPWTVNFDDERRTCARTCSAILPYILEKSVGFAGIHPRVSGKQEAPTDRGIREPAEGSVRPTSLHSFAWRRRSALVMTETELKLMAAAAKIGLRTSPKKG